MKEIEVKILEINVEEVRKKILDLGAKKILDADIEYNILDFPDNILFKNKDLLRIRRVGDKTELCFKNKCQQRDIKLCQETEVNTSNYEDTMKIFKGLGFKIIAQEMKHRESYKLGNVRFEIETYPNIPTYLEIESDNEEDLKEGVKKLGFTMEQTTNMNTYELVQHYRK